MVVEKELSTAGMTMLEESKIGATKGFTAYLNYGDNVLVALSVVFSKYHKKGSILCAHILPSYTVH